MKRKVTHVVKGPVDRGPTKREKEIAAHIVNGLMNHEIATRLTLSQKTVEAHRANLYRKLHVRNTAQLMQVALASGLVKMSGIRTA
jgi:DNA-binding NarL/FixJ family response regulator